MTNDKQDIREAFEREARKKYPKIDLGDRWGSAYRTPFVDHLWKGFQLAWQSLQEQGEALWFTEDSRGHFIYARDKDSADDFVRLRTDAFPDQAPFRATSLYRHPPAPVAVPEKLSLHEVGDFIIAGQQCERLRFQQGWNECRQAMIDHQQAALFRAHNGGED